MKYETKKTEIFLKKVKGQATSSIRFLELQQVLQCRVESERDRGQWGRPECTGARTRTDVEPG